MYGSIQSSKSLIGSFKMAEVAIRYNEFIPRLYNLSKSLGFTAGEIMPSRAFCSDESQGHPIILIAKHFGAFPFNHGSIGGIVSTDHHGPHAHHGKDLLIIHASHVGYNPQSKDFGTYRRLQTENQVETTNCGKICGTLDWYLEQYEFAKNNITLSKSGDEFHIAIDNLLLHDDREQGLFLALDQLVKKSDTGKITALRSLSTSKEFLVSPELLKNIDTHCCKEDVPLAIGSQLAPEMFTFKRQSNDLMDHNLINAMPYIVTSKWPALKAAQVNTQVEFDHAFRSIVQEPEYQGKQLLFVSGLNVDISPVEGQLFPLTKFIPWAAHYQTADGKHQTWEQAELYEKLKAQPLDNPDQVNLEDAIEIMGRHEEIILPF